MTGFAVLVFCQVTVMAKDHGCSISEIVPDIFGLRGNGHQHDQSRSKAGNNPPVHRNPP